MKLIVGLGNPGHEYHLTRHNIGYLALEELLLDTDASLSEQSKLKAKIARTTIAGQACIAMQSTTYMNDSGNAVQLVRNYYKIAVEDILVLHDEADLPFGEIRVKQGGGSAGHNGIKSIAQHLASEDFWRIRMGVSNDLRQHIDTSDFVLANFTKSEQEHLHDLLHTAVSRVQSLV